MVVRSGQVKRIPEIVGFVQISPESAAFLPVKIS
jgi:hypothetical protein